MLNNIAYKYIFSNDFEIICADLVEKELNIYFNECKKSAYDYSLLVTQNYKNHNKANFEKMLLNKSELISLMENIISKIKNVSNRYSIIGEKDIECEFNENLLYMDILNNTILENKTAYNITNCCEKLINKILLESSKLFNFGIVSDILLKKVNFGSLILGNNSSQKLIKKHEKELYNQIEGILLNIKTDLRNMIFNHVINELKDYLIA